MDIDCFPTQCVMQPSRPSPRELGRKHAIADFSASTANAHLTGSSLPRLHTKGRNLTISALLNSSQNHPDTPTGMHLWNRQNSVYTRPTAGFGLPESVPSSARSVNGDQYAQPLTPLGTAPWADSYFLHTSLLVPEEPLLVSDIVGDSHLSPRQPHEVTNPSGNVSIAVPPLDVTENSMLMSSGINKPALDKSLETSFMCVEDSDPGPIAQSTSPWGEGTNSHHMEDSMDPQSAKSLPKTPPRASPVNVPFGTPGHRELTAFARDDPMASRLIAEDAISLGGVEAAWINVPGGDDPTESSLSLDIPSANRLYPAPKINYTINASCCEPTRGSCGSSLTLQLKLSIMPNACLDSPISFINNGRDDPSLLNTESV